jgi:hypothetical protein
MNEELIQIYNAVRRAHQNIMALLLDNLWKEMTVENVSATNFQQTVHEIMKLVYFHAQKNVLLSIEDIYKQHSVNTELIDQMIMEREKESCEAITCIANETSAYKNGSPVPLRIAKAAKEKLILIEKHNREVSEQKERFSLMKVNTPTARPLRPA